MQDAAEQLASIAEQADEADKSVPSTNNGMYCRFPVQFPECIYRRCFILIFMNKLCIFILTAQKDPSKSTAEEKKSTVSKSEGTYILFF